MIDIVRDPPICDFCSSKEVVAAYHCPDFELQGPIGFGSKGGFAACADCQKLIEAGDRQGLEDRSISTYIEKNGPVPEYVIRPALHQFHAEFWRLIRQ